MRGIVRDVAQPGPSGERKWFLSMAGRQFGPELWAIPLDSQDERITAIHLGALITVDGQIEAVNNLGIVTYVRPNLRPSVASRPAASSPHVVQILRRRRGARERSAGSPGMEGTGAR